MKKILREIHIYGGLIFLPYLFIFGISTLYINHDFKLFRENQDWTETKNQIEIEDSGDNQILAESIRDSLGLIGWCPWWTQNRKESRFRFSIEHFGSEHRIDANITTGQLVVKRRSKGFLSVLQSMHFLGEKVPRANMVINSWQYYLNFTVIYLILAIVSGIYLFVNRKKELRTGLVIIGGFLTFSYSLMVYIWLVG